MSEFIKSVIGGLIAIIGGLIALILIYDGIHFISQGIREMSIPGANCFATIIRGCVSLSVVAVVWCVFQIVTLRNQVEYQKTLIDALAKPNYN